MIRNTDREFLLALGVEPYEPERLYQTMRSRGRDRLIQAMAIVQLVGLIAALVWTSI